MVEIIDVVSYDLLSEMAGNLIVDQVKEKPDSLLCFAGGDTPLGVIAHFVKRVQTEKIDTSKLSFVSLDEWVGLDGSDTGSCRKYLNESLFTPLGVTPSQLCFFDGKSNDLESECIKANEFIKARGKIDLSLLGVGVNGHLGFNEPHSTIDQLAYVSKLDASTQEVGKKYFNGTMNSDAGITLSLGQLLASEAIVVVANGASKKKAIEALRTMTFDPEYSVTAIVDHPNAKAIITI